MPNKKRKSISVKADKSSSSFEILNSADESIASPMYQEYLNLLVKYHSLFEEEKYPLVSASNFSLLVYPYEFVNPRDFTIRTLKERTRFLDIRNKNSGKIRIVKLVKDKNGDVKVKEPLGEPVSIIKYRPFNSGFFYSWEILHNYDLIRENMAILELSSYPSFLEAASYFSLKYNKKNVRLSLIASEKYFFSEVNPEISKKNLKFYVQYLDVDYVLLNKYLDAGMVFEGDKKDLIFCNLLDNYGDAYIYKEFLNARTLFYQLLFGLFHLKKNGSLLIVTTAITRKFHADIILIGKTFFKDVHLYFPEVRNLEKDSGNVIIYRDFQDNLEDFQDIFKRLFNYFYKEDSTGKKYDYKNPEYYSKKFLTILPFKEKNHNYGFIRQFNNVLYAKRVAFYTKLIGLKEQVSVKNSNREMLKNEQYINSVVWARKYDLEYFKMNPHSYKLEFERLILQDMYSLHKQVFFKFTSIADDDVEQVAMPQTLSILANNMYIKSLLIDTRDFRKWGSIRRKVAFYRPLFKEIDLVKRVQRITGITTLSQGWLKLFEILVKFPLLPKTGNLIRTFHMCEAPGNFISATEYFVENRTEIKDWQWTAQSLHPKIADLGDFYGFIKKNPKRWLWGPSGTGDITNLENIRYYARAMENVKLVTSDCGISDDTEDYDNMISKIMFCQIVMILNGLPEGSNAVMKMFQKFQFPALFSAFFMMYQRFEKLYIHKSNLNRQSPEFYVVGIGHKKVNEEKLEEMLDFTQRFDKSKQFFDTYPSSFVYQMEKVMTELAENFIFEVERVIFYFDNYEELGEKNQNQIKKYIDKKNDEWLEAVGLIP